jgi:hypothetical protein
VNLLRKSHFGQISRSNSLNRTTIRLIRSKILTQNDIPSLRFPKSDRLLELVDWTGRILQDDKRGAIPETTPPILEQLNIDPKHWCYLSQNFESQFKSLVSKSYPIKEACQQLGKQWVHGIRACEKVFPHLTNLAIKQKIAWPNHRLLNS